ncbi:MAG TPA: hypothetical protein VHU80_02770 [Polyangiaceae bacterium]|jgi:hypothetical protein|nr:hypothetical protein [Polyangiaceae bacterium]
MGLGIDERCTGTASRHSSEAEGVRAAGANRVPDCVAGADGVAGTYCVDGVADCVVATGVDGAAGAETVETSAAEYACALPANEAAANRARPTYKTLRVP